MEQVKNILALRMRLGNGALVEIPRENPLIMMPDRDWDVLVVRLAETSGMLRTLGEVNPPHDAVVVVEGNYVHWCMVTMDEINEFVGNNGGRVVQNDNLFLRSAQPDEQTIRIGLPYPAANNNITVAEVDCNLSIDPVSGALLSSDRSVATARTVAAQLLFVTHLQRESNMWQREQIDRIIRHGFVRSDMPNDEVLQNILARALVTPVPPANNTGAPKKTVELTIPSKFVEATLQIDEDAFNGITRMEIAGNGTHLVFVDGRAPIEVSPLVWHAIDAARKGGDASPSSDTEELSATFSEPNFAVVTVTAADMFFEALEFGYISADANQFMLVTNEYEKGATDNTNAELSVSGFDFYVMGALSGMKLYGSVFISQDVIAARRVSFAKSQLKIGGYGSVFSSGIPADAASRLTDDIRKLNTSL